MSTRQKNNSWFKVNKITNDIYIIDDNRQSNIYLVVGNEKCLLIDTGWGIGDLSGLVSSITDLPLIVVNTHGHPDHVGGGYLFSDIHIKKEDLSILEESFNYESRKWVLKNLLQGPYPEFFKPEKWVKETINNIVPIKDGHTFNLGNKEIEVISMPGHTPGSIGLLDKKEKILFSGDSILEGTIWMHLDHSTDLSKFLESLYIIKEKSDKIDKILPAHGRASLEFQIVNELVNGIKDILSGKREGKYHQTFAGDGLLCMFNSCGIVYKGI